jgi:DNA (cytosine-5)-methyltransferase 1
MRSKKISVGSLCSGIEAASVAWKDLDFQFEWFSEIADFPARFLRLKYPTIPNLGDMCEIPAQLKKNAIATPDLICGGTPCQAFSLAGWKKGLEDTRGNLTLKFVDIVETNDLARKKKKLPPSLVLWENVEGVLRDKTNAFGIFLSSLAGLEEEITLNKWPRAGLLRGPKRNIAWRVLDAKYFGLPQQRRRLYVLAGGKDFHPENILFDKFPEENPAKQFEKQKLSFKKAGYSIEVFRSYTDCLYSAYGTKWNGNAAAYNGSLFVHQNKRLRRLTPLECERLMGFPDNYTDIPKVKPTNRFQGVGNSWAVPVIQWLGARILKMKATQKIKDLVPLKTGATYELFDISGAQLPLMTALEFNGTEIPEHPTIGNIADIIDVDAPENFYISPVGCKGILRRKEERQLTINPRLEEVLKSISSQWSNEKIEAISRVQSRGRFSSP